jgi:signal transduction histidine kinase
MIAPERRRESAHFIHESGHHLLAVVNEILDMSRIETGNCEIRPEAFAPRQVMADARDLLALRADQAGVELSRRIAARDRMTGGEPVRKSA